MSRAAAVLSCVLWLGCGSSSADPVADGGNAKSTDAGPSPARSSVLRVDAAAPEARASGGAAQDASAPDAATPPGPGGLIPVQRIYPDAGAPPPAAAEVPAQDGGQPAAMDADGGAEGCNASRCWCERVCELGLALECPAEGSMTTCVAQCDVPSASCYDYFLRVLRCKAELPAAAYSCDPDLLVFVVGGCAAQEDALQICRTN